MISSALAKQDVKCLIESHKVFNA